MAKTKLSREDVALQKLDRVYANTDMSVEEYEVEQRKIWSGTSFYLPDEKRGVIEGSLHGDHSSIAALIKICVIVIVVIVVMVIVLGFIGTLVDLPGSDSIPGQSFEDGD